MKICAHCRIEKPLDEFYRQHTQRDGRRHICKPCAGNYAKAFRRDNADKIAQYNIERRPLYLGHVEANRDWRQSNPERYSAQTKVGNAIRDGKLLPWPVCAVPECSDRPHAHHPDYSRPLDVVWLCAKHHKEAHALVECAA